MDKTFVKGLTLMELLARSDAPRGITEIAVELGMTKSNVHRLLATLQSQGYVRKLVQPSSYELTSKLWELGALVHSRLQVTKFSAQSMLQLEQETGESVHLSIIDGHDVVYIDKRDGSQPIKSYTSIGGRAPIWCVATGKAMLAHSPATFIDDVLHRLKRFTERTIVDPSELCDQLKSIRRTGYAVNQGEWRDGVSGIASPIRNFEGDVIAAIGISGPTTRFRQKEIRSRAEFVVDAAATISATLGFRRVPPRVVNEAGKR